MISFEHYLEYLRKRQQKSYHDMALSWGISSRTLHKLEAHEKVRDSIVDHLKTVTEFNSIEPGALETYEKMLNPFFRHILYANYDEASKMAHQLLDHEHALRHSPLVIPVTLYLWVYVIHTQNPIIDIDEYYQDLCLLKPYMDESQHQLFLVEITGYYFIKGQLKKSFDHFDETIPRIQDNHFKALNYFLVGASGVNEIQSMDQSIRYLTMAHQIFNEYGNFLRANRCNAFLQVAYIHSRRYADFLDLYAKKQQYLHEDEDIPRMDAFIEGNLARYYVITKQYDKACDVLRAVSFPLNINGFLYLVAAFQSGSKEDLSRLMANPDLESQLLNAHHKLFLKALKHWFETGDQKAFISSTQEAVIRAEKANDYIAYIALSPVLIDCLKRAKKYKEAYHTASKELDILRQFH